MGWRADGGLWLLVRGGGLFLSKGTGVRICEHIYLSQFFCSRESQFFKLSWGNMINVHMFYFLDEVAFA